MTHPNDMTAWPDIACQRGHTRHESELVTVDLGVRHGYRDLAQIPASLATTFQMFIYPPKTYPVDGGPYCPAHDAVSETIKSHGIWEPQETAMVSAVCKSSPRGSLVVDVGAQLGWFSFLAASQGLPVLAIEADPENMALLSASAAVNSFVIDRRCERIHAGSRFGDIETPLRLLKIDVEGAEYGVLMAFADQITDGDIDHILMEVSPVFNDSYPDLVIWLMDLDYEPFRFPPKAVPPVALGENLPEALKPLKRLGAEKIREFIAGCHQENIWFKRAGATW